jgi:uroporphyrin-III C-methyltransferase
MAERRRKGKVYIVGAGPGDPELLTVKAKRIIEGASCIVHDALVGEGILSLAPGDAELIDAGKRKGRHRMEQDEINRLLVELAETGKEVVRLKGGDPFIFGRGAEEALFLKSSGIDFEVVPGLSSALAGPCLSNLPLTMRGVSDRVLILSARGPGGEEINWDCINVAGQTTVFMMGLSGARSISEKLKAGGLPGRTPVAVIFDASLRTQHVVITDLEGLPASVSAGERDAAGLIVIGEAVRYARELG